MDIKVGNILRKLIYILFLFSLGIIALLWLNHISLTKQKDTLLEEIQSTNKKIALIKKKRYEENKVLLARHMKEKSALERRVINAEDRIKRLIVEQKSIQEKNGS